MAAERKGFVDTLVNLVSRLGTAQSKMAAMQYGQNLMTREQADFAYRGSWLARKIIDIPAKDATREWRAWQAEEQQIEAIEAEEKRLAVKQKVKRAMVQARLYGGAALVMGVGQDDAKEPLDVERVAQGDLKFLHVVSRYDFSAQEINRLVLDPLYGEPISYSVNHPTLGTQIIHPSRVIRFLGAEVPGEQAGNECWGDSVLQAVDEAIKAAGSTAAGIAEMVQEAKVDVIKIKGFSMNMGSGDPAYETGLVRRFNVAATAKSTLGFLLMDAEEEWTRITQSFSELPELIDTFMQIAAGAADIPVTRLLGQSPAGLNATGESDLVNYYDRIASDQENELTSSLDRLDECLIRSATGARDPAIFYNWNPLWQMDATQTADVALKKAQAISIYATNALVPDRALAGAVQNMLVEDGLLPGLEGLLAEEEDMEPGEELGGEEDEETQTSPVVQEVMRKALEAAGVRDALDARPRTLYVRRNVLNGQEIVRWAKAQGFETTLPTSDMHVTIAFSKAPLDWMKVGEDWQGNSQGEVTIAPGGPRLVERLGEAVVLMFNSSQLSWRHMAIRNAGATWDHPEYQPHITITYDPPRGLDLEALEPYRGEIKLGPEIFEEVKEDWKETIEEVGS